MTTTLELDGVTKRFGATTALAALDLTVAAGELVTLLGPSGCGKTTALRIVAGFDQPDVGTVRVAGVDVSRVPAEKRDMGMVFQSYSLFPHLTCRQNVEFGLRLRKQSGSARQKRGAEMLELVGLSEMVDRYPHQLSGGQQQRVALARALAISPRVLLLDEPLSALDAKVRVGLRDEIRRIQRELGITTLFVTHDQEEAMAISDRVGVMSNGHLEQLAPPAEVYQRPSTAFVARFVGVVSAIPATVSDSRSLLVGGHPIGVGSANGWAPGAGVSVVVRPEDIRLVDVQGAPLTGVVVAASFLGAVTRVTVRLDRPEGCQVLVDVASGQGGVPEPGHPTGLEITRRDPFVEPLAPLAALGS